MLVAVVRGPLAPHAVLVNDGFRFPRRNGATTRYLSEPEIAAAYRDRFAAGGSQVKRAEEIEAQAVEYLAPGDDKCWVVVSLVPDAPGEMIIDQAALRAVQGELRLSRPTVLPTSLAWMEVRVGRRCLLASDSMNYGAPGRWLSAVLHHDGAGVFAMNACDVARAAQYAQWARLQAEPQPAGNRWLHDEQAVNAILTGLRFLARGRATGRAAASSSAASACMTGFLSIRGTGARIDT